ncbi:MAG: hypothetical protein S4CHLAM37_00770 [Chlamydiia bacterium]|nr:hypothetical protein [Chlamydiia bacterium]
MIYQPNLQLSGLIYGPQQHHLDHIGTLCTMLDIPLVVTDEELEKQAKHFYPMLVTFLFDYVAAPQKIVQNYDVIITAMPREMFQTTFFMAEQLAKKSPLSIWCPHGNSDKGGNTFFMEALSKEKAVFIYGKKMFDFLEEKHALPLDCEILTVGNYRYEFYKKHKPFYDKIVESEIASKLKKGNKTYLYSPTWSDCEKASSFHLALPHLLENLPEDINLIVKLHPNTLFEEDMKMKKLVWKYESEPNVLFLEDFPVIYPLLDFIDVYIGDTSSIGYDILALNKPMFFLNVQEDLKHRYLQQCGTNISRADFSKIFQIIEKCLESDKEHFSQQRKKAHLYTFAEDVSFDEISKNLESLCKSLKT